jgi:phospholipase/carboxylesterase
MPSLLRSATLLTLVAALACDNGPTPPDQALIDALTVNTQPTAPTQEAAKGTTALGIASPRDGWLYVPSLYVHTTPTPLVVLLHDANASASYWEDFKPFADTHGVALLAIDSRYQTWDGIQTGNFGVDIDFLEQALAFTFDRVNVDPARISIAGFGDGGTYALTVGIANAAFFTRVLAHTPALLMTPFARGFPKTFVSAGANDDVVLWTTTRDNVVVPLRGQGFTVEFVAYDGGHSVPTDVRNRAFEIMKAQ